MTFRPDLLRRAVYEPVTEILDMDTFLDNIDKTQVLTKNDVPYLCGSVGCIAGNLMLQFAIDNTLSMCDVLKNDWLTDAAYLVGLPMSLAHRLFLESHWPERLQAAEPWVEKEEIQAAVEDFIEHYEAGRDWV